MPLAKITEKRRPAIIRSCGACGWCRKGKLLDRCAHPDAPRTPTVHSPKGAMNVKRDRPPPAACPFRNPTD